MKTERAYYDYTGGEAVQAAILEVRPQGERTALILDKTVFYPEGGGQSADRGTINGIPLLDVQEEGGEILHLVPAAASLKPGPGELRLDAPRRRDFTVHHTAQHLLSGTILRMTGFPTVSMHLGEELCTIDVDAPVISAEALLAVEDAVQDAVEADAPVAIHRCPPEKAEDFPLRKTPPQGEEVIRVVEIRGHDFSPCCGTHLNSTGPIGILRVLGAEKYKGKTRISFIAGRRVFRESRILRQNGELVSRALKVPVAETGRGVLALLERMNQLEKRLKALEEEAAGFKAAALLRRWGLPEQAGSGEELPGRGRRFAEILPDAGMNEVLAIGRAAQKLTGGIVLLASSGELKFAAFCSDREVKLPELFREAMESRGGHGGGGPSFFQGAFSSLPDLSAFMQAAGSSNFTYTPKGGDPKLSPTAKAGGAIPPPPG